MGAGCSVVVNPALHGKWFQLSNRNMVDFQCMAVGRHALTVGQRVTWLLIALLVWVCMQIGLLGLSG